MAIVSMSFNLKVTLVFLLICDFCFPLATYNTDTLVLVQTLARHGDRTPSATFPNDPYAHLWIELGMEQLTEKGVYQLIELGQFLRKRYNSFIPEVYQKDVIYVRSTSTERTLMSALSCMHGIFPATKKVNSSLVIGQQLVPIHSMLKEHDQLLKMSSPCPLYKRIFREFKETPIFQAEVKRFAYLLSALEANTGLLKVSLSKAWSICDPIVVWADRRMTLPDWVTPRVVEDCLAVGHLKHTISFSTPELSRLRGGPLVRQMLIDSRLVAAEKPDNPQRRRLISYFAHDSTIAALMSHFRVHNNRKPPIASCFILELHRRPSVSVDKHPGSNDTQLFLRVFLRNDTTVEPYPLRFSMCPDEYDCPLKLVEQVLLPTVPQDIADECDTDPSMPPTLQFAQHHVEYAQLTVGLTAIIGILLILLLYCNC